MTEMTVPDEAPSRLTIEQRCRRRDTTAFVAPETVDALGEKLIDIVADRRMTKMHRYLGEHGGTPRLFPGLRVWRGGYSGGTTVRSRQSASVSLASAARSFEGIGFHVSRDDASEEQLRDRYHHPEKHWLGRRENVTLVQLDGCPGEPGRNDSIRVEHWNEHGVGQESIIVFDDVDPVQEIAWDLKGDPLRQVYMDDDWCLDHEKHFEDPSHVYRYGTCERRRATLAENIAVLAALAAKVESEAQR